MNAKKPKPWPAEHLERVPNCPVCKSPERKLRHRGLWDATFFTADGEWDLWQCASCSSGWLDPRPDEASIGQAYGRYYTHADTAPPAKSGLLHRVMKGLANDYRLWRFGSRREIRIPGGRLAGRLVPSRTQNIDLEMRYLPKPSPESRNLLDVGCGNGAFLALAAEAGWRSFGVEPDEQAAMLASDRGLEVRTRLEDWASSGITFDAMTFNHTVEHMHDPVAMLQLASSMLRPGGFLYIETPNMLAVGHDIYQRHWRGLETPRHLVLFSDQALQTTLAECGFSAVRVPDRPSPLLPMAEMSRRQAAGLDPYSDEAMPASAPPSPTSRDIADERNIITRREFLTVTAHKDPVP